MTVCGGRRRFHGTNVKRIAEFLHKEPKANIFASVHHLFTFVFYRFVDGGFYLVLAARGDKFEKDKSNTRGLKVQMIYPPPSFFDQPLKLQRHSSLNYERHS